MALGASFFVVSAEAQQLTFEPLGIPTGRGGSWAHGMSADGTVVTGVTNTNPKWRGFRWTRAEGLVDLPGLSDFTDQTWATGVSADGSSIVGTAYAAQGSVAVRWRSDSTIPLEPPIVGMTNSGAVSASSDGGIIAGNDGARAFRWTAPTGRINLPPLPGPFVPRVWGMSNDGSVIVGVDDFQTRSWTWTPSTGTQLFGNYPGAASTSVRSVSADGRYIIGSYTSDGLVSVGYRWSADEGFESLGPSSLVRLASIACSANGSVIVGYGELPDGHGRPFVWTEGQGMQDLFTILLSAGLPVAGWKELEAHAISADGLTIAGDGINPDGEHEAWIAAIPGPGVAGVFLVSAVFMVRRHRPC